MKKPRNLGIYHLGPGCDVPVYLHFNPEGSSNFNLGCHDRAAVINIRYDPDWEEVLDGCLHELMEFTYMTMGLGYSSDTTHVPCYIGRHFVVTHTDLDEAVSRVARVMARLVPKLKTEWEKKACVKKR